MRKLARTSWAVSSGALGAAWGGALATSFSRKRCASRKRLLYRTSFDFASNITLAALVTACPTSRQVGAAIPRWGAGSVRLASGFLHFRPDAASVGKSRFS